MKKIVDLVPGDLVPVRKEAALPLAVIAEMLKDGS